MKRSRLLRSSFIVVSASVAAAGAVACSSSNSSGTADTSDSGARNPAGCPASAPMFQDPCTGTLSCSYNEGSFTNACGTFPKVTEAHCTGGKWQISASTVSCNPPGMPFDAGADAPSEGGSEAGDGGDGG